MVGMVATRKRLAFFLCLLIVVLVALAGRVGWVQLVDGKRLGAKAREQLRESIVVHSPRGAIYDRNGKELAVSSMTKSLYAHPKQIKDPDGMAALLAPYVDEPAEKIREKIADGTFVWLKRMMEPEKLEALEKRIASDKISGLGFAEESKRYYPNNTLAAHVLGFVGMDDVGLDGIEMVVDRLLKKGRVEQTIDTDSYGRPIFQSVFSFMPPRQTKNVILTIDSGLQHIVEKSLDKAVASTGARGAVAIAMDPSTGEILAMASRPTYDPNQFFRFSENELKNRAVSIVYEPGSTFKPVVAAAALEEKLVAPEDRFFDKGYVEVSGRRIQNWSGEGYGNVSFTDIIKYSINTGFAEVGKRVGPVKLDQYVRSFGFGKPTDIELAGEESGILFRPAEMRDSDLATMSIGQSIAVTPLQLVTAISAVANNGMLLKPHIIKEVRNADGSVSESFPPVQVRQVIRPETAQTLTSMLEKVISEGGGKSAQVKGYQFAGKTGTAEKIGPNGGYLAGHYIASFVGFGPLPAPKITLLIVLDDPSGVYYGGQIAAPVFQEIMTQIMRYWVVVPSGGSQFLSAEEEKPVNRPQLAAPPPLPPRQPPPGKVLVPYLTGRSMREVAELLHQQKLTLMPEGSGVAVRQSLPPYSVANPGDEITVYFESR
ncbi:MAG TPA: penicillin-binding transpeptidase domain-containing protein [Patescibacteria group bacterium]|nr:penicillin-binding transpeptidase domain-containing protein [Patescibacteria group bacterium]